MRSFAKAFVKDIESHLKTARADWGGGASLRDEDVITFFLEEKCCEDGSYLYHAFADPGDAPVFFGSVSEVSAAWLDEVDLRFYFQATAEEFRAPGFLTPVAIHRRT